MSGWSITPQLTTLERTRPPAWVVLTTTRPFSSARKALTSSMVGILRSPFVNVGSCLSRSTLPTTANQS